jgi:hypothetical protein
LVLPFFSEFFTLGCGGADETNSNCKLSGLHGCGSFFLRKSFSHGQVAQWLIALLSGSGIGSIGIRLPLFITHHSIAALHPRHRL